MITDGHRCDCLIVGAGITGMTTALNLADAGARVTIVERYVPAAMASGWTLAGVRQSGRDPAELPLARRAVDLWQQMDERLSAGTGYRRSGNLRLARTEKEAQIIRTLVEEQRAAGLDIELLDQAALRKFAPALNPELLCASFCHSDGQADPQATSLALQQANERQGVRVITGTRVLGMDVQAGRLSSVRTDRGTLHADQCILATGIQTNDLLQPLERAIPLQWACVTVLQSEPLPELLTPVIGVANADLALRQQSDGRLRMTSGAEFTDVGVEEHQGLPRVDTSETTRNATLSRIAMVLPAAANARIAHHWGGLLDMTPDALPVIDRVPGIDGLIVAAGFSGHGFGIGPAVGEIVAQMALRGDTGLPIDAFAFDRFGSGEHMTPELHG